VLVLLACISPMSRELLEAEIGFKLVACELLEPDFGFKLLASFASMSR
jgi:hypothetical protein